jgi:hypothetical protein
MSKASYVAITLLNEARSGKLNSQSSPTVPVPKNLFTDVPLFAQLPISKTSPERFDHGPPAGCGFGFLQPM